MKQRITDEQGNVIVELALLIGVIVLISIAGLEISRAINHMQVAAVLSREVASAAYRDCTSREDDAAFTEQCLDGIQQDYQQFGSHLIPNSDFVLSVYYWDEASKKVKLAGVSPKTAKPGPNPVQGYGSRVDELNLDSQLIKDHQVLVIGEAFVPFSPILAMGFNMLNLRGGLFYDVTVI